VAGLITIMPVVLGIVSLLVKVGIVKILTFLFFLVCAGILITQGVFALMLCLGSLLMLVFLVALQI
jgi:hypothetical protein